MKIESNKAVVATPQAHTEFLRHVVDLMERVEGSGQEAARQLYTSMRDSIDVGDNPFSQARHLHALEDASDSWDVEETPPEVLRELLSLSEQIQGFDPGYTVCDFTVGYHWIKEFAGDAEIAPPR